MSIELVLALGAIVIAAIGLLVSPFARAICWDSFVHPKYECDWQKHGKHVHEIKHPSDEVQD